MAEVFWPDETNPATGGGSEPQSGYGPFNALVWEKLFSKSAGYILPALAIYRTSVSGSPAIAVKIGDMWRCAKTPNPKATAQRIWNTYNPATLWAER